MKKIEELREAVADLEARGLVKESTETITPTQESGAEKLSPTDQARQMLETATHNLAETLKNAMEKMGTGIVPAIEKSLNFVNEHALETGFSFVILLNLATIALLNNKEELIELLTK